MQINQLVETNKTENKHTRIVPILLIVLWIWTFAINNIIRLIFTSIPDWFQPVYYVIGYITISVFLFLEREKLNYYFIDRSSLIIFITISGFLKIFFSNSLPTLVTSFIYWIFAIGLLVLVIKRRDYYSKLPIIHFKMVVAGFVAGSGLFIIEAVIPLFILGMISFIKPGSIIPFFTQFAYNLGTAPLWEEMIYRGFIPGYLIQKGWKENRVWLLQGLLYWIAHFSQQSTISFWIFLPIATIVFSILCLRARSILPNVIAHTLHNTSVEYLLSLFK